VFNGFSKLYMKMAMALIDGHGWRRSEGDRHGRMKPHCQNLARRIVGIAVRQNQHGFHLVDAEGWTGALRHYFPARSTPLSIELDVPIRHTATCFDLNAPGGTRAPNLQVRSLALCPIALRARRGRVGGIAAMRNVAI